MASLEGAGAFERLPVRGVVILAGAGAKRTGDNGDGAGAKPLGERRFGRTTMASTSRCMSGVSGFGGSRRDCRTASDGGMSDEAECNSFRSLSAKHSP